MFLYAVTFSHGLKRHLDYLWLQIKKTKMNENPTINDAIALKDYSQNGKCCSMKKFCEDEGYD